MPRPASREIYRKRFSCSWYINLTAINWNQGSAKPFFWQQKYCWVILRRWLFPSRIRPNAIRERPVRFAVDIVVTFFLHAYGNTAPLMSLIEKITVLVRPTSISLPLASNLSMVHNPGWLLKPDRHFDRLPAVKLNGSCQDRNDLCDRLSAVHLITLCTREADFAVTP